MVCEKWRQSEGPKTVREKVRPAEVPRAAWEGPGSLSSMSLLHGPATAPPVLPSTANIFVFPPAAQKITSCSNRNRSYWWNNTGIRSPSIQVSWVCTPPVTPLPSPRKRTVRSVTSSPVCVIYMGSDAFIEHKQSTFRFRKECLCTP